MNEGLPSSTDPVPIQLARMETKLDLSLTNHADQLKDHEVRLRTVEAESVSSKAVNRWKATTGVTALVAVLGLISQIVQALIS